MISKAQIETRRSLVLLATLLLTALLPVVSAPVGVILAAPQTDGVVFEPSWYSDEAKTRDLSWGDYDRDGDLDLAFGNDGPTQVYRNEGGILSLTWTESGENNGVSVDWGDYDGDGDLDLAAGKRVYRNDMGVLTLFWEAASEGGWSYTRSIAWGDYDGDRDLDLVLGNHFGHDQIYRNQNGTFILSWQSSESGYTNGVAWGDYDGDSDLDLAVTGGNPVFGGLEPDRIYRNEGGDFDGIAWKATFDGAQMDIAWGDYDEDGDLDLATSDYIYRNDGGKLTLVWQSNNQCLSRASGVAWGDYDKDGDLDFAGGNCVYRNVGSAFEFVWQGISSEGNYVVAWGDYDGDGDLDFAVADSHQSRIYRNNNDVFVGLVSNWRELENKSVAWGDYDNDGDQDLAVGSRVAPNQILRNDEGVLIPAWKAPAISNTFAVAWGDYDGDNDLDLAVGNYRQPNQLYRNENGTLTLVWQASVDNDTWSLAWGDYDNDGDLDLAAGGFELIFYRNVGGNLQIDEQPDVKDFPFEDIAWGDYDNDGDLDFAAGDGPTIYSNTDGILSLAWEAPIWRSGDTVAWGDYDGDGDLDLATSDFLEPVRIYRNDDNNFSIIWRAEFAEQTTSITWGDYDEDGDLDLAVGNSGYPNRIYRNDEGTLTSAWKAEEVADTRNIAWIDYDRDGDLDLSAATEFQPNLLYRNEVFSAGNQSNRPPTVTVRRPVGLPDAPLYSTPKIISNRIIQIPYTLSDPEGDTIYEIRGFYSLDGGGSWQQAVPTSDTQLRNLSTNPGNYTFYWDISATNVQNFQLFLPMIGHSLSKAISGKAEPVQDLNGRVTVATAPSDTQGLFGKYDNVVFRIVAYPDFRPHPYEVPNFSQRPSTAATTYPFRVRGTQVQVVDEREQPVHNALVYRLRAGESRGGDRFPGELILTDRQGYLQGHGLLQIASSNRIGDQLVALMPVHNTPKYDLFFTSAAVAPTGLLAQEVTAPGVQQISIRSSNPLVLIKLAVSLEWDARRDPQFMDQLKRDLRRASELLYDWTDGQVALGEITIYHDKQRWDDLLGEQGQVLTSTADIQIYASNRLRPNANQGGIVDHPTVDLNHSTIVYEPGQVRISATWNRNGEAGGTLGEDWPRTLAHELGHYALFLDDDYLGMDNIGELTTIEGCRSAMSDPYRDDYSELQPPGAEWDKSCAQTLSERTTGRADWETLQTFYQNQPLNFSLRRPASFNEQPGPSILPLTLTTFREVVPSTALPLENQLYTLLDAEGQSYSASRSARAMLFSQTGSRVTDLGMPVAGQVLARGAHTDDELCVYDLPNYHLGCGTLTDRTSEIRLYRQPTWQPDLRITEITSHTVSLVIPVASVGQPQPAHLRAKLFPDLGEPVETMLMLRGGQYSGTLMLPETGSAAISGLVRILVDNDPQRQVVTDYSLGGEPGPRRRRKSRNKRRSPAVSTDGQAILFTDNIQFQPGEFYAFQTTPVLPPAPPWSVRVGQGYYLLASEGAPPLTGTTTLTPSLSISYLENELLSGTEGGLGVYYQAIGGGPWIPLASTLDSGDNSVTTRAAQEGLYSLMASLDLRRGWNLVSYPWPQANSVRETLRQLNGDGYYTTVYGYNETEPDDPWEVFDTNIPAEWAGLVNDLEELRYGRGYWINVTTPTFPEITAVRSSAQGEQTQAVALNSPPATYYGTVPGVAPDERVTIEATVGNVLCGRTTSQPWKVGGQLRAAYVIAVDEAGTTPGCGNPTAQVTLTFKQDSTVIRTVRTVWDNNQVHRLILDYAYQIYTPFLARSTSMPRVDLELAGLNLVPTTPKAGQSVEVHVTIRNAGTSDITRAFWVDLYVDPESVPEVNTTWSDLSELGISWRVYGLRAGETRVLSSLAPNDPGDPSKNYSDFTAFPTPGRHTLYALVDSYAPDEEDGAIIEGNESNNLVGPISVQVGDAAPATQNVPLQTPRVERRPR